MIRKHVFAALAALSVTSVVFLSEFTDTRTVLLLGPDFTSPEWHFERKIDVPTARQDLFLTPMGGASPVPMLAEFEPLDWERESAVMERERMAEVMAENRRLQLHNMELERAVASLVGEKQLDQTMTRDAAPHPHLPSVRGGWGTELKFESAELKLGMPSEAAEGLLAALGLNYAELATLLAQGSAAIEKEFYATGRDRDAANYDYVKSCPAQDQACVPAHVKEAIGRGQYHGGALGPEDFDFEHGGMTLTDFVAHPNSKLAGLEEAEVLALRLYTTDSYTVFNTPLRQHTRPHPLRITVWYLAEGLKKLRSVDAVQNPVDFRRTKHFWRGMRDMELNASSFEAHGGTELAPMSTTDARRVAFTYANSTHPLIFDFRASGMSRGCDISFLSVFPKEKEFLYPPLTYLEPAGTSHIDGYDVIVVTPQIS